MSMAPWIVEPPLNIDRICIAGKARASSQTASGQILPLRWGWRHALLLSVSGSAGRSLIIPGLIILNCLRSISLPPYWQPLGKLLLDLNQIIRLRVQTRRLIPLETRFAVPANLPVGIAQMIVEHGILRPQFNGLFEERDGSRVVSKLVVRPPQAIDDVAVVRLQRDRLFDQLQSFLQIAILIDPRISQIIQHKWLIG